MKLKLIFLGIFFIFAALPPMHAAFTIKDGKLVDAAEVPEMPVEDHYDAAVAAYQQRHWGEASRHFYIIMYGFPSSTYAQESSFFLAICYYNVAEYDQANTTFSQYLQGKDHPRLFQEAMEYKYAIAEKFRLGARRRLFGQRQLPKWSTGGTLALSIYDEVIAALPCHELAACALYSKALLHRSRSEYRESIDCLQMIVRRFPKHELTPECYLLINAVYLDQCRLEFQNPDILAFAEINYRRFQQQFPTEERLNACEEGVLAIKEVYGGGLVETGLFYERVGKRHASAIYYQNAIRQFPETYAAERARSRLVAIGMEVPETNPQEPPSHIPSETKEAAETKKLAEKERTAEKIETIDVPRAKEESEPDPEDNVKIDWIP